MLGSLAGNGLVMCTGGKHFCMIHSDGKRRVQEEKEDLKKRGEEVRTMRRQVEEECWDDLE